MSTWTIRRVGDMARLINGHPFDSRDFTPTGDVPLVRIRDITAADFETYVPQHTVPQDKVLKDGDVVIGMDGDFNVIRWRRGAAALNQRVCALRDTGVSDLRFLAYALPDHLKVINDLTYSTTVKHLSSGQVTGLRITAPDRDDQGRIADYLDRESATIDALIKKQRALVGALRERRSAAIEHALEAAADRGLLLKRLVSRVDQGISPDTSSATGLEDIWVLKSGASNDGFFNEEASKPVPASVTVPLGIELHEGDLVVSRASGSPRLVGSAAIVGQLSRRLVLSDKNFRLVPSQNVWARYLYWALNSQIYREQVLRSISGAEGLANNLPLSKLMNFTVPVPPLAEQREIADHLDRETAKIDALIAKAERFIELAQERRAALITAAVTGQIEISTED